MTATSQVTFIEFGGKEHRVHVANGTTIMQGAVANNVRGIIAECGGSCSCATCHVYVDPTWMDRVGPKSEIEDSMLDAVCGLQPNSRLSCQIEITEQLDGLIVRMPEKQV